MTYEHLADYQPNLTLNTKECAHLAGKDRRTIVAWIRGGHLPATRLPGKRGHYQVVWQDLKKVLSKPALNV